MASFAHGHRCCVSMLAANKWVNMQQTFSVRKLNTKYISAQQMPNDDLHAVFYGLMWEWFGKEYPERTKPAIKSTTEAV